MKSKTYFKLIVIGLSLYLPATQVLAATKLDWTTPGTRVNGTVLLLTELKSAIVYKDGKAFKTVTPYLNTWTDTTVDCATHSYAVSVVDTGSLESANSVSVDSTIDKVGCTPKSPTGLTVTIQ